MREILHRQGRVEQKDGMRFYEQDIVMLDYVYTGDVTIELELKYVLPGFGVIFSEDSKGATVDSEPAQSILVRLGSDEFSVYRKKNMTQTRMYNGSCLFAPDKKTHKLKFMKDGNYVRVFEILKNGKKELGSYNLKGSMISRFYVGFYSNARNVLKNVDIYDNRPQHWFTNIKNSNGGRVSFSYAQIMVECAEKDIEIEQQMIPLKKGTYFLSYDKEPVDGELIEDSYVFPYDEEEIHAPKKSLLKREEKLYGGTPYFELSKDGMVNLLFQVNSGILKNLAIKDDWRTDFVATDEEGGHKEGSYIKLYFKGLKKLLWKGTIEKVPAHTLTEAVPYSIFTYAERKLSVNNAGINLNEEYTYTIELVGSSWRLIIKNANDEQVFKRDYATGEESARIFDNVSGEITQMTITNDKDEEIDLIFQQVIKKYVPAAITSPIIVTDRDDQPLDISSSFRRLENGTYYFVNWERVISRADKYIELDKPMVDIGYVNMYGIRGEVDWDKLYYAKDKDHIYSMEAAENYSLIASTYFDAASDTLLVLSEDLMAMGFDYFIVDYLKDKSYAINPIHDGTEYEVEISCSEDFIHCYYDMDENGNIHDYKINDELKPPDDVYLVLRRNEVTE